MLQGSANSYFLVMMWVRRLIVHLLSNTHLPKVGHGIN